MTDESKSTIDMVTVFHLYLPSCLYDYLLDVSLWFMKFKDFFVQNGWYFVFMREDLDIFMGIFILYKLINKILSF